MMINLEETIRRLAGSAEILRTLVQTIPDEQAQWKPDPETWSIREVMEHVYNEERMDFRLHLKELLSDPPQPWGAFCHVDYISTAGLRQSLDDFLMERQDSITWLMALDSPDWEAKLEATFGPEAEVVVLSAGDVLVSWVEHDFLHMRQMVELLHAWNEKQAAPYSLQYAGGW